MTARTHGAADRDGERTNYIDEIARAIYVQTDSDEPNENDMRLYRIYALLALSVGPKVTDKMVHDAWSAWVAGDRPDHHSLVPFGELRRDVQELDRRYRDAIAYVAVSHGLWETS